MKKYTILFLIAGLAILLILQKKVVLPFVFKIASSDLFLIDSKDQGSQTPISTPLTEFAYLHCNNHIKAKLGPNVSISFPEKPINAWSLGNYQFIINGEISIADSTANITIKKYICRINYKNSDNEEGLADFTNWSIEGLSGLDSI